MAVTPAKGSGIGQVSFEDADFMTRLTRMANPVPRDTNLRPLTSREKVALVNPRQGGITDALSPLGDALMGRSSNLGILPLSPITGDRDTIGGEILQGLGNIGLAGLEGLRRTGETVSEIPFAFGRALGTESESAYNKRMGRLANTLDEQTRMQQGQKGSGFSIAAPTSIVGGPSYQQTPTDPDQDAAIRSQVRDAQNITDETGIFGDIREPGMGVPDFVGGVPAAQDEITQALAAASGQDAEAFREEERKRALAQGMQEGTASPSTASQGTASGTTVEGVDNPVKQATVEALDDILRQVRPNSKPKDYDDYMKEFADLTGLDVSGQPDNSQALMAFGLALMQNKAGKGFNVGQMLSEVGAAGEKAMPALAAARKEAKTTRIKAAEFAISRKDKDEAAALNRTHYYAIPKGKGGDSAILQNLNKAQSVRINGRELDDLLNKEDFSSNYELIPAKSYLDIVKDAAKPTDLGSPYLKTLQKTPLFEGATDFFTVNVQVADGNYKGQRRPNLIAEEVGVLEGRFESAEKELNLQEKEFAELTRLVKEGVTVGDALGTVATSFGKRFGVGVGQGTTSLQRAQYILKKMAVKNTKDILGEAGKTISDADRALVKEIVGDIDSIMGADEDELLNRINQVYDMVVTKGRRNLDAGYRSLSEKGINIGPYDPSRQGGTPLNEDDQAELERLRKAQGVGA